MAEVLESPVDSPATEMRDAPAVVLNRKPFTKENAREMAMRAVQRRKDLAEQARLTVEMGALNEAEYRQNQLTRVRAHIERLHRKIELCAEPKELHFLSQALKNIAELESKLRAPAPQSPASKRGNQASGPLD